MPISHPYLPKELKLPHYKANDKSVAEMLGVFFGIVGVVLIGTWFAAGASKNPKFTFSQKLVLCWFMMCGLIHTVLEGYFGLFHDTLAGDMSFLGQLWKEYSLGDSRYLSSDSFMVCMERVTAAVDGPLCFLALILYFRNSPYRYIVQLIVSLCQLYGDTLYFMTEVFEGFSHGYMYHPQYFWFYFVTMNSFWIVIPLCLICQACGQLAKAQRGLDKQKVNTNSSKQDKKSKSNDVKSKNDKKKKS